MKRTALALIRFYQRHLSRSLPPACRFVPSCSDYVYEAIDRYGLWKGGWLGLRRLSRCHPLNPGGYDPVPGGACPGDLQNASHSEEERAL